MNEPLNNIPNAEWMMAAGKAIELYDQLHQLALKPGELDPTLSAVYLELNSQLFSLERLAKGVMA